MDAATTNVFAVFDNGTLAGTGPIQSVAFYVSQGEPTGGEYDGNRLYNNLEISSPSSTLPPALQSVTRNGSGVNLAWSAIAGRTYQVQVQDQFNAGQLDQFGGHLRGDQYHRDSRRCSAARYKTVLPNSAAAMKAGATADTQSVASM